jgi:hypothetical protein
VMESFRPFTATGTAFPWSLKEDLLPETSIESMSLDVLALSCQRDANNFCSEKILP